MAGQLADWFWHQIRRETVLKPSQTQQKIPSVGVSFSGGGVRSAAFAMGALTSLAENNVLKHVDYMSSVSGGGFTALSYLTHLKGMPPTTEVMLLQRHRVPPAAPRVASH